MVSLANDSFSSDISEQRLSENTFAPKYKPRKVNANRDFPPGCGSNASMKNVKPDDNGGSRDDGKLQASLLPKREIVADEVCISGLAYIMKSEVRENSGKTSAEADGVKNIGVIDPLILPVKSTFTHQNVVDSSGVDKSSVILECPSDETSIPQNTNAFPLVVEGDVIHEVTDNPIDVKRIELSDALSGNVTTTPMSGSSGDFVDLINETRDTEASMKGRKSDSSSGNSIFTEKFGIEGVKPSQSDGVSVVKEAKLDNSSAQFRFKDKYFRRKVTAKRHFPPHCGSNASIPVQVLLTETSGTDFEKVNVESEEIGSIEIKKNHQNISVETEAKSDVCISETMYNESDGAGFEPRPDEKNGITSYGLAENDGTEGSKGKEFVVFPFGKVEINSSPDDSTSNNVSQGEAVHVQMAAPYFPSSKEEVTVSNSDGEVSGQDQKQHNVLHQHKSMPAPLTCDFKSDTNACPNNPDGNAFLSSLNVNGCEDHGACSEHVLDVLPISVCMPGFENNDDNSSRFADYSPRESDKAISDELDQEIVQCLMAEPHCPWRKRKQILTKSNGRVSRKTEQKPKLSSRFRAKPVTKKSVTIPKILGLKKKKQVLTFKDTGATSGALVLANDPSHGFNNDSPSSSKQRHLEVTLPPFGANSSGHCDARNKVRQTLRLFSAICRKLLHEEEAQSLPEDEGKSGLPCRNKKRIDLEAMSIMKKKEKVGKTKKILGQVPGVEVGDEFQYRVELVIVGIHRLYQNGIETMNLSGIPVATSIVSSGAYPDDVEKADVLIYSGQGGNVVGNPKLKPEDQKLEKGNLALRNSISTQTPVRVVRGWKETKSVDPLDPKPKLVTTYVYDGLYTVKNYWTETGPHGKQVFMFELRRNPGQPELAWKQLKKSGKSKIRPGVCIEDISQGQERFPISAVNTINDEKPPPFNYISKTRYPDWFHPIPLPCCDCTGKCSDSKKCRCAVMNGSEIPYNRNGALVETKSLVYECGPLCGCPTSCYNRVTQRGIKFQLEVFKTESRGWGVRSLTSIPSGSFICEYAGELLEDREAEERVGSDEYLFDIGRNYLDSPSHDENDVDSKIEGGYTVDAALYGNVGRFVNHSCLPNLYAQNVLFDHNDTRMPHIMLFAVENIPPLQELTYDYNYSMGQIADTDGNIKVKQCFCGAAQCTGRLY